MSDCQPWTVIHLELSRELPTLVARRGYENIYLVVWWCSIPLGQITILEDQLPINPIQLFELIIREITPNISAQLKFYGLTPTFQQLQAGSCAPLKAIKQHLHELDKRPKPTISVVICTRDRPEQLEKCLRSLQELNPPPFEIVVVDNAPSSSAAETIVTNLSSVRYVQESRPGLSIARNTGIQNVTGDIVAFTDDDVIVQKNWIERLGSSFLRPEIMAVAGLILPKELNTESQILFEIEHGYLAGQYHPRLFSHAFFEQTCNIGTPVWQIGAGANMAFRRDIFQSLGQFDERLGAGASGCSEDSEMWYRILAHGEACLYEPTAVVYHSHRSSLDDLNHQMYQYMRGHITALFIQFFRYYHWGNLYRLFVALPRHYLGCLCMGLVKGFQGKYRTTIWEVLGSLAGIGYYLQHWQGTANPYTGDR